MAVLLTKQASECCYSGKGYRDVTHVTVYTSTNAEEKIQDVRVKHFLTSVLIGWLSLCLQQPIVDFLYAISA